MLTDIFAYRYAGVPLWEEVPSGKKLKKKQDAYWFKVFAS